MCALIVDEASGLNESLLVPLVEAELGRLAAAGKLVLVERREVEQVLREQELAALFGAEGVGRRIEVGALLRADVLVLLRARAVPADPAAGAEEGAKGPVAEVVVCETSTGLRLETGAIGPGADGEAPVAAAATEVVERGLGELAEPVREICAVPPFVNQDLTHDFAHLKSAYAKLVEQHLLSRPGVRVVELDEARALARELALDGKRRLDRAAPPLYVLGEYRHDGAGDARVVNVALRVTRGDDELGAREGSRLVPTSAAEFVRTAAAELLAAANRAVAAAAVPAGGRAGGRVEARQLGERAEVFRRLGDDDEAAALLEAAVLLDPDDSALRVRAMSLLGRMARARWPASPAESPEGVRVAGSYHLRGLDHAEAALRDPDRSWHATIDDPFFRFTLFSIHWSHSADGKPVPQVVGELRAREAEALRRIAESRVVAGREDALQFLTAAARAVPPEARPAFVLDLLRRHQDLPGGHQWAFDWPRIINDDERLGESDDGRQLLDAIAALPNPEMAAGVAALRAWLATELPERRARKAEAEARLRPIEPPAPTGDVAEVSKSGVTFERLKLPRHMRLVPLDDGVDFRLAHPPMLMRRAGEVERLAEPADGWPRHGFSEAVYDGRYVWVTVSPQFEDDPPLIVVEPQAAQVWQIKADQGLPPMKAMAGRRGSDMNRRFAIAPLGPGRVCLAGYFGRTWVADVTFDPARGATVRVLHEARDKGDVERVKDWRSTTIAFEPRYMFVLTPGGEGGARGGKPPRQTVVLGRQVNVNGTVNLSDPVALHPLLIDPDAGTVGVLEEELEVGDTGQIAAAGDAIYWVRYQAWTRKFPEVLTYALWRVRLPELRKERVAERAFVGRASNTVLALIQGRAIVAGEEFWATDLKTGTAGPLGGTLPFALRFGVAPVLMSSNHYGLLLKDRDTGDIWKVALP